MGKPRRTFTREFKGEAVQLVTELGGSFAEAAANLIAICWLQVSFYDSLIAQIREFTPARVRVLQ